jgi:hypothetical protein
MNPTASTPCAVKFLIFRPFLNRAKSENDFERSKQIAAVVVSEGKFVEVGLQMLRGNAVMRPYQPSLKI